MEWASFLQCSSSDSNLIAIACQASRNLISTVLHSYILQQIIWTLTLTHVNDRSCRTLASLQFKDTSCQLLQVTCYWSVWVYRLSSINYLLFPQSWRNNSMSACRGDQPTVGGNDELMFAYSYHWLNVRVLLCINTILDCINSAYRTELFILLLPFSMKNRKHMSKIITADLFVWWAFPLGSLQVTVIRLFFR